MTVRMSPPSCSQCGDSGVDVDDNGRILECVCGGAIRATHLGLLRSHGWHARVDEAALPVLRWRLHKILDDESDDRDYIFSPDSVPYTFLRDAVQKLCGT